MASESDPASRRVPSLVSYCQRVLSAHADAITCLGDDVRYDVIKPVLECCSADTLLRLEQSSPYLEQDTSGLWERLCFQSYPLLAKQFVQNDDKQPESWRHQYFLLREAEASRLEEVSSRLRNQRMEEAERKREREVKLTDKLPPPKRARSTWTTSSQPKTLFQKTRQEATKLHRSLYTPRIAQIHHGKVYRPLTTGPLTAGSLTASPTKSINTGTPVKTLSIGSPSILSSTQSKSSTNPVFQKLPSPSPPPQLSPTHSHSQGTEPRPSKPPIQKKDPMASLFMPKHRALSQRPTHVGNNRTAPAR